MAMKPTDFLTKKLPEVISAAHAEMKNLADQGDQDAKQRYADLSALPGAMHLVLEGKGGADLYLISDGPQFRAETKAPSAPVLLTIALPAEAMELWLEELEEEVEQMLAGLRKRLVKNSPKKTRAALDRLAQEKLRFHLVLKDTPDFEEVRIKIATGSSEVPAQPGFTATLDYDTFEQLRERKIKPQAVLSKLQLSGDSARAMQLGMELMQRRGA